MEGREDPGDVLVHLVQHRWNQGAPKVCHGLSYKTNMSAMSDIILTDSSAGLGWFPGAGWCEPWPAYVPRGWILDGTGVRSSSCGSIQSDVKAFEGERGLRQHQETYLGQYLSHGSM